MDLLNDTTDIFDPMDIDSMEEDILPLHRLTQGLPNELWIIIFTFLKKNNLKSVRRVCQRFSLLAGPLLFDRVYVSAHQINMDVFAEIAQHPTLSLYPRVLVYQVVQFRTKPDYSLQKYFIRLCNQLRFFLPNLVNKSHLFSEECRELLRVAEKCGDDREAPEPYPDATSFQIVQQGFKYYTEKVAEENHINQSREFLASLCLGLAKLINVRKVEMGKWYDFIGTNIDRSNIPLDLSFQPCPLARSWNLFHLQPGCITWGRYLEFDNVLSMFSLTRRCMQHLDFNFCHIVLREVFDPKLKLSRSFRQHGFGTMKHLERLTIRIENPMCPRWEASSAASELDGGTVERKDVSMKLLADILPQMRKLQQLSLCIIAVTPSPYQNMEFHPFSDIFSNHKLPALHSLRLQGFTGTEAQMSAFIRANPQLRHVNFTLIKLDDGLWADLLDNMRKWLHLQTLHLVGPLWMTHMESVDLFGLLVPDLLRKLEQYVLHGGRNPLRGSE